MDDLRDLVFGVAAGTLSFLLGLGGVRLTTTDDLQHAPEAFEYIYKTAVDNGFPGRLTPVTGPRRLLPRP